MNQEMLVTMDFGLSTEQRALQDAVAAVLDDCSTLPAVRRVIKGDAAAQATLGGALAQLGVHAIVVPPEHGGLGLGLLEAALAAELAGHFVVPADWMGTTLAALALDWAGSPAQQASWLSRIVAGTARFGLALSHATSEREEQFVAADVGGLRGRSIFVLCPPDATHLLLPDDDGALWIVDRDSAGPGLRPLQTIDRTRYFSILEMEAVAGERLGGAQGPDLVDRLIASARVLIAADALGAAQRMLDMAVAYAHERRQFGVPIGSFQAVKHLCAEMAAALEPCRALVWHAADSFRQQTPETLVTACHAKARVADVAQFVARSATEVHGGIGFTDELGLHLWFKRIGVDRQLWGGPSSLRAEAARRQGWSY